ncbi:hypothetical protein TNCV_1988511 [Trichonephila clavipes]|nr:hypothetical protein TNCV_1988511 [Trichonephila clavipes]
MYTQFSTLEARKYNYNYQDDGNSSDMLFCLRINYQFKEKIVMELCFLDYKNVYVKKKFNVAITLAEWHSWFVAGLVCLSLRVRLQTKEFHDAENQQRPCRMIIRHVKHSSSALDKIKFTRMVSHLSELWVSKLLEVIGILPIKCPIKKKYQLPRNVPSLQC